jgi:hypothetical protein
VHQYTHMATVTFTTKFDLSLDPKQFVFEDTSDYVGQGIALADVNGCFKITTPSGYIIYNNSDYSNSGCDIRNSVDRINQTVIQLPLGADNFPEAGTYIIDYSVYDTNTTAYYTASNSYTYAYTQPEISILQTVDCVSPLFTSVDTTNYVVAGISPTLIRTHTITFPVGSGLSPVSGATSTITVGKDDFANGTQTTSLSVSLQYEFTDGLIVRDVVTGVKEILVDCTYVCTIYCGVRSIEQQMESAEGSNDVEYQRLKDLFNQIMSLVALSKLAIECGKSSDVNGYLTEIKAHGNFTDDCSCSGDEPTLVSGLGGIVSNVVVQSGGTPVVVTPVTVGSTTTYTVTLSGAFVTLVNSHYNTVIASGYGVQSSLVTVGDTKTYTLRIALDTVRNESTTPISVPVANNTSISGCTATASTTGTYIIIFEADQIATGVEDITYRLKKAGSTIGTDRKVTSSGASINKMGIVQIQNLTATNAVSLEVDSASGSDIGARSITLFRIA